MKKIVKISLALLLISGVNLQASCPSAVAIQTVTTGNLNQPSTIAYSPIISSGGNTYSYAAAANSNGFSVSIYSVNQSSGIFTFVSNSTPAIPSGGVYAVAYSPQIGGNYYAAVGVNTGTAVPAVYIYSVNPTTGAFTLVNSYTTNPSQAFTYSVAYSPSINGNYYLIVAQNTGSVYVFPVNSVDGSLGGQVSGSPYSVGTAAYYAAYSPQIGGNYYAAVINPINGVYVFPVNAINGTFGTQVSGSPYAAGSLPYAIAYSPDGTHAAVPNYVSGTVSVFPVNATNGTFGTAATFGTGSNPQSVAYSPNGSYAAVANEGSNTVSLYAVNPITGAFGLGATPGTGVHPYSVVFSPNSNFFATANFGTSFSNSSLSVFSVFGGSVAPVLINASIDGSLDVTVTGSGAVAGATITIVSDGTPTANTGTADGSGNFNFTGATPVSSGSHTITVTQTVGGCASGLSNALTVPPSAPRLVRATISSGIVTVNGTNAQSNATILIFADGATTSIGTGNATTAGNFSFSATTPLSSNAHAIRVQQEVNGSFSGLSNIVYVLSC